MHTDWLNREKGPLLSVVWVSPLVGVFDFRLNWNSSIVGELDLPSFLVSVGS